MNNIRSLFFNFKDNKKAISGFTSYSVLILFTVILLSISYLVYENSKIKISEKNIELEVLNSAQTFRSSLLELNAFEGSTLTYENKYDSDGILIFLKNKSIITTKVFNGKVISKNISALGIRFCSTYSFTPLTKTSFRSNSSCVSLN